ncbi:rho GTPase-activating protein 22 [Pelomyxa schiedti]|nr:rho GTPase-activating protein 22 [Pelomyxa schiedti]
MGIHKSSSLMSLNPPQSQSQSSAATGIGTSQHHSQQQLVIPPPLPVVSPPVLRPPKMPVGCYVLLSRNVNERHPTTVAKNFSALLWDDRIVLEGVRESDDIALACWYTCNSNTPDFSKTTAATTPATPANTTPANTSHTITPSPNCVNSANQALEPEDTDTLVAHANLTPRTFIYTPSSQMDVQLTCVANTTKEHSIKISLIFRAFDRVFVKEGWMMKSSKNQRWKTMWFTLYSATLTYYKGYEKEAPKGIIKLNTESFLESHKSAHKKCGHSFSFIIHTPRRSVFFRCSDQAECDEWEQALSQHLAAYSPGATHTQLFCVSLEALVQRPAEQAAHSHIPLPIQAILHVLMEEGPKEEGIFRVPGLKDEIDKCVKLLDKGKPIPSTTSPHSLAGLLKLFLRSLPDPLIPTALSTEISAIFSLTCVHEKNSEIARILNKFPLSHKVLLLEISKLCSRIAQSPRTQMTSQNLAVVIGPNLSRDSTDHSATSVLSMLRGVRTSSLLFESLVQNYDDIVHPRPLQPVSSSPKRNYRQARVSPDSNPPTTLSDENSPQTTHTSPSSQSSAHDDSAASDLCALFMSQANETGQMTTAQFAEFFDRLYEVSTTLGMDYKDRRSIIKLAVDSSTGTVTKETFMQLCMSLLME